MCGNPSPFEILKEALPGHVLIGLDEPGQSLIAELQLVKLSTLALELEFERSSPHPDVPVAQRRQTKAVVAPRILIVADADVGYVHKLHDGREDTLLRQGAPK
jgi:hypothetical protein